MRHTKLIAERYTNHITSRWMARRKVINSHTFIYTQSRINYVINGHWSTIINPKVATQLWRSVIVAMWRTSPTACYNWYKWRSCAICECDLTLQETKQIRYPCHSDSFDAMHAVRASNCVASDFPSLRTIFVCRLPYISPFATEYTIPTDSLRSFKMQPTTSYAIYVYAECRSSPDSSLLWF